MKLAAFALLIANVSSASVSSEKSLLKGLSSDVTIGDVAATLDEFCHRREGGQSVCKQSIGELLGNAESSFCDAHCPPARRQLLAREQPHQSFLQNDLEEALGLKQR